MDSSAAKITQNPAEAGAPVAVISAVAISGAKPPNTAEARL